MNANSGICWNAIIAGTVMALITGSLFNLLGVGLGFVLFSPDVAVLGGLGIGAILWLVVSAMISMVAGGWIAGRFGGLMKSFDAALHGLLVWGLATVITFILVATTAGSLVSGTLSAVSKSIGVIGESVSNTAYLSPQIGETLQNIIPDLTPAIDKITQRANEIVRASGKNTSNENALEELDRTINRFFTAEKTKDIAEARIHIANLLVQLTGMRTDEAQQVISVWQESYNEMKGDILQKSQAANEQILAATEKATNALGQFALISFFVLLVGAAAAMLGGYEGSKESEEINEREESLS